ncbi:MAG: hypothetical protein ACLGHP_01655 [Vicinamibacteria bacterium]
MRFVALRGPDEAARGAVSIKDLASGEQFELAEAEVPARLAGLRAEVAR